MFVFSSLFPGITDRLASLPMSSWCTEQCSSLFWLTAHPTGQRNTTYPQRCVSAKISTYKNHIKRGAGNWGFSWQKLQHQLHRSAQGLLVPLWASSCPCSTNLLFRPPAWPYWLQMHPQFPARASRDLHTHLAFCESLFCVTAKRLTDQRSCPEARAAVTELL